MSYKQFEAMIKAYRKTLGSAYPRQDVLAVLAVFDHCRANPATSQDQICQSTALNPGNVNKIINRACEEEWIHRDTGRTSEGKKQLHLTDAGRRILAEFDTCCADAGAVTPHNGSAPDQLLSQPAPKRSAHGNSKKRMEDSAQSL